MEIALRISPSHRTFARHHNCFSFIGLSSFFSKEGCFPLIRILAEPLYHPPHPSIGVRLARGDFNVVLATQGLRGSIPTILRGIFYQEAYRSSLMRRNISRTVRVPCPLCSSRPPTFVDVPLDGFIIAGSNEDVESFC